MFFGLTIEKLLLIGVIAAFVVGPERLPRYAEALAGLDRSALASGCRPRRTRVRDEMGEDFDDVDWRTLDPRQYDPRRIIREALLDDAPVPRASPRRPPRRPRATPPTTPVRSPFLPATSRRRSTSKRPDAVSRRQRGRSGSDRPDEPARRARASVVGEPLDRDRRRIVGMGDDGRDAGIRVRRAAPG